MEKCKLGVEKVDIIDLMDYLFYVKLDFSGMEEESGIPLSDRVDAFDEASIAKNLYESVSPFGRTYEQIKATAAAHVMGCPSCYDIYKKSVEKSAFGVAEAERSIPDCRTEPCSSRFGEIRKEGDNDLLGILK